MSRPLRRCLALPPLIQVPALDQGADLGVGDGAFEHPEAAIWVDVAQPAVAEQVRGALDGAGDPVGAFDLRDLDIDDAEPEADLRAQALEGGQFLGRPVGDLHDDMIDMERVQIVDQPVPTALLDRLAAIVAETEMNRRLAVHGIEHPIDRRRPFPFLRRARQVGFVELHDIGIDMADLFGEHVGDCQHEGRHVRVVPVDQRLGEHVRSGQRELEPRSGELPRHPAGAGQVEMAG